MLSPSQHYQQDLLAPDFMADPTQAAAIQLLDDLYYQLMDRAKKSTHWYRKLFYKSNSIKGLYLWGGVGTGKTYLMNTFFNSLTFPQKKRFHFHEFMQQVHTRLRELQGKADPLKLVAKEWAKNVFVLCFDEFFVKDIADAMLMGNLLKALFDEGVCLVATSNVQPQNLYQNGLQRERFLPTIQILTENVTILQVDNQVDYRIKHIKPADIFFIPNDDYAKRMMMQSFHYYAQADIAGHAALVINNRTIEVIREAEKVIWFSFSALCETATSADDYLIIANRYPAVMVSDIPIFHEKHLDVLIRFINFIDVMYDQHRLVILSLAVNLEKIYQGTAWSFEFKRTISRLQEMQGQNYIDACQIH